MKLLRFKLNTKFRSLPKGFELIFRKNSSLDRDKLNQFHPFCFAGLNGSGKSNILEALSLIFFYLECSFSKYLPDDFNEAFEKSNIPFSFELEYLIYKQDNDSIIPIKIIKPDNKPVEFYRFSEDGEIIRVSTVPVREGIIKSNAVAKQYLPEIVIGYSSGENEILSLPFLKTRLIHSDNYKQSLLEDEKYEKKPLTSLVYIDYSMSQAVLLSNFLMQKEFEDEKLDLLQPIKEILEIEKLQSFRLVIKDFLIRKEESSKSKNRKLLSQLKEKGELSIIDKLKLCSTSSYLTADGELVLDYFVNRETKTAFQKNFDSPYDLFQDLQTLLELNLHSINETLKKTIYTSNSMYVSEKMPKPEGKDLVFYFNDFLIKKKNDDQPVLVKNLSDGEHQFLHSMGICLMLKNKTALLLLDEPETHFNPDWRSKFISVLKDSLERGESNNLVRDILITSHSPFIISDCFPDKVVVFKKGHQPVNAWDMNFNTFGTSVNIVLEEIFRKEESIPNYSLSELNKIKNRKFDSIEDIQKAKEDSRLLGDSPEKVFLFRDLLLKEEEFKEEN
ncbi:restriction system-associated AAA family ATPase [Flavobacterium sp. TR2]|uniref:restriction system-associated AAA family ATPase n=1 Tax=Flavobacterium sp. TR2 TaxID=2977321 RepID=UPI0021B11EC6|nr:restriction system-associated AAA family ATPase [Flavobacterium sp. TR2]UWY27865.1 restriction system-associated AAA family ATPase [Flavobacterium sp. TR2]